ncbi:MAG TPA: NUDIX hydrolase, partial [Solirubrobacteraceae bacterium]|nr:NUDIX hydrolase [Solirubrobacteraceae bacterium]
MALTPGILARGPWELERVAARWREDPFVAPPDALERADAAIGALRDRGSPAHDGLAARLVSFDARGDSLELELQPVR